MFGKLKLTAHNLTITALALVVVATLNVTAGTTTFLEVLSGQEMSNGTYEPVFMFFWIFIIALGVTTVFSLLNRYDFSTVSAAITLTAILIISFSVNMWDEFIFILYPIDSIIMLAICILQKKSATNQDS